MPKATRTSTRNRASQPTQPNPSSTRQTRSRQRPSALPPAPTKPKRAPRPPKWDFLSRTQDVIETDPNRRNSLFKLPRELLLHIASELPLVNVICLTLTCKAATSLLSTQSWAQSKKEPWTMDRAEFRELFTRDWGHTLEWCERCDTFHPSLPPPRSHREAKLTKRCFGQYASIDYLPQDSEHGYQPVFAHIATALDESAAHAAPRAKGPLIDLLSGDFTISRENLLWRLESTAQRIDGNLVLKHVHSLRPSGPGRGRLRAQDILRLPVRLCPHQSTSTAVPERSRYVKGGRTELNSPLLTHAILSAFPASQSSPPNTALYKRLAPSEEAQIAHSGAGSTVWRCRSCPTKYCVESTDEGLVITSWHYFGRDMLHAEKYWRWFVRRTGTMLGTDKRNDEWWAPSRSVPDFVCEV